jgi:methylated-DNA-[protein]-cysteine S-methyltransferase
MEIYQAKLAAHFAVLGITTDGERLAGIDFLPPGTPLLAPQNALAREVCAQLEFYLRDPGFRFNLPLALAGTDFQQRVWRELRKIPAGSTMAYAGLAQRAASGARAVANACGANPIPIIIPCHRVVARHGLGGFMRGREAGSLSIKQWLLAHERSESIHT